MMRKFNLFEMKPLYFTAVVAAILSGAATLGAQSEYSGGDPVGKVSYSLPMTSLSFEVEAVQEKFYAGPYARYASKYLGIEVKQKDAVTYQLTDVRMTSFVEADQSRRFLIDAKDGALRSMLLKLTSEGLVSTDTGNVGAEQAWKFPVATRGDFSGKGVTSNLTTEATTLYQSVKKESAYGKVPVQQSMVVEKSLEKRAEEAAAMIFRLRDQRLRILTGDTDATYSGEAMGAAISEIARLENEYMTLFTGYSETQTQRMTFDVVPEKERDSQLYVAFRISESDGLVPADNLSGRPVILEIVPQEVEQPVLDKKAAKSAKLPHVVYRIPAVCKVKLTDGQTVLMQSRVPVYQMGLESSMPVEAKSK